MTKDNVDSARNVREAIATNRFQKGIMYLLLIGLTTLFFLGDLKLSQEDLKSLLRGVWPSFFVILMATFWYDYIVKSESKLESDIALKKLEKEIEIQAEKFIKDEVKEKITDFIIYPGSECYIFRLIGKKFIKNPQLLEKYIEFASEQLFDQPIYYNLVIKYILSQISDDSAFYQLDRFEQFDYDVRRNIFTLAICDDTEVINMLLSEGKEIDYISGISRISDYGFQEVFDNTNLRALYSTEGINRRTKILGKRLLTSEETKVLFNKWDVDDKYLDKIGLIHFETFELKGMASFELKQRLKMRLDDHIYCWFADRLTYLKRIEIDYRNILTVGRDFNVQHFFSNPLSKFLHDEEMGRVNVEYEGWVIKGQGTLLAWRDYEQ